MGCTAGPLRKAPAFVVVVVVAVGVTVRVLERLHGNRTPCSFLCFGMA